MKNNKKSKINLNTYNYDIQLPNEEIKQILKNSYYQKFMQEAENSDVDMNHLENIFTNEIYYHAMKIVPLLERKILFLTYIENVRLDDICRKLKLEPKNVISLKHKGINHFKHNLDMLYKLENLKKGNKK